MRVRTLSSTGDFTFGSSQQNFLVDSPAAVAQVVGTTLRLFMGEWYLDTTAGTPYFTSILGYHSQEEADTAIQNTILGVTVIVSATDVPNGYTPGQSVPGVLGIVNYESVRDPVSRQFSATCVLNTIYGPTPYAISNYPNF